MTAIQPARLKKQVLDLASHFDDPKIFVRELNEILVLYGRHVFRTGKTVTPIVMLPSYRTPEPVLRQIEIELTPLVEKNALSGIALCDALWNESFYEYKMLAARIIGKIPVEYSEEALIRIQSWSLKIKEKSINDILYKKSLINIISNDPNCIMSRVHSWLNSDKSTEKLFGIQIILASLENKDFDNLPLIFNLIAPYVRDSPTILRPYITEILHKLSQRTPKETAYFLLQNLELSIDQDTAWFIRRCLNDFPPDTQTSLRSAIRKQENL